MKRTSLFRALLCLSVSAVPLAARADISVNSDPVGYYRVPLTTGFQTIGVSLVNPPEIVSMVASSTASSVTFTENSIDVGAIIDITKEFYIEVIYGPTSPTDPLVGNRFDVDEAETFSNSPDGQIALDQFSPNNTAAPVPDLSGYRIEVRQHITLAEAFDKDPLHADFDLGKADQVQVYNGVSFTTYYLLGDNTGGPKIWGTATLQPAEDVVIPPGVGALFKRSTQAAGSADVVVTGKVRSNPFVQPLFPGFNFVAEPYPAHASFNERNAFPPDFYGDLDIGKADQVQIFNSGSSSFDTYFLAGNLTLGYFWLLSTDLSTDRSDEEVFDFRRSVFIKKKDLTLGYRVPLGWTP